jgi:hypothetical protein
MKQGLDEVIHLRDGTRAHYKGGALHRLDGPAVEKPDGSQRWYVEGQIHRDDGPAIITKGYVSKWYRRNKLHREDGPAIVFDERDDSLKSDRWYFNGHRINVRNINEFKEAIRIYLIEEIMTQ